MKSKTPKRQARKTRAFNLKEIVNREVGDAYGLGLCHGLNWARTMDHEKPQRVNEGWVKYSDRLFKELGREIKAMPESK